MSDFLASALIQAKAELSTKRSAGSALYGTKVKGRGSAAPARKKPKWHGDASLLTSTRRQGGKHVVDSSGLSDYDLERSRKALERKEKQYRKMYRRGTDMALEGDAAENLLIDFDRKYAEGHRMQDSSSEDDDARLPEDDEDDPVIEVEDEFGRARKIRKSETLRHERPVGGEGPTARPAQLIYGRHLQHFDPDAQRKDEIWAEEEASREVHYDPKFDIRHRGAGYINLGRGQERHGRLTDLSRAHEETLQTRQGHRARDSSDRVTGSSTEGGQDPQEADGIHPARKAQVSNTQKSTAADVATDAARIKTGEAFLDSIF